MTVTNVVAIIAIVIRCRAGVLKTLPRLAAVCGLLLAAGCDGGPMAGPMMGGVRIPTIPASALPEPGSEGAELITRYCTQCHGVPDPAAHTAAGWPDTVRRMMDYMRSHRGGMMMRVTVPDPAERGAIAAYLQRHAQRALNTADYRSALASSQGRVFRKVCAQCHGLPDPKQHPAAQWPGVVARMKQHMRTMGVSVPDEDTLQKVTGFLEKYASAGK